MVLPIPVIPITEEGKTHMSRFERLSHVLWHCQYHIVWVPKYRYRVLEGEFGREVYHCIQSYSDRLGCRVEELNVQPDHIHLLIRVPPKQSISDLMGALKGRSAIRVFKQYPYLKKRPYWGNHFWAKGYCVDTVGLDIDMIRKYVRYQEAAEKRQEQLDI